MNNVEYRLYSEICKLDSQCWINIPPEAKGLVAYGISDTVLCDHLHTRMLIEEAAGRTRLGVGRTSSGAWWIYETQHVPYEGDTSYTVESLDESVSKLCAYLIVHAIRLHIDWKTILENKQPDNKVPEETKIPCDFLPHGYIGPGYEDANNSAWRNCLRIRLAKQDREIAELQKRLAACIELPTEMENIQHSLDFAETLCNCDDVAWAQKAIMRRDAAIAATVKEQLSKRGN